MTLSSSSFSFTQESAFLQAMTGPIANFWEQRQEGFIKGVAKKKIYWCKFTHPQHTKAIVVVNGRIEAACKYQELFYDLYQQGYDIYSFDHRGQGLSERLVTGSDMGHVNDFNDYILDMDAVLRQHDLSHYQQRFLLGHSMGGAIATRYIQSHPNHPFHGLMLSSPMFGIQLPKFLSPVAIPVSQILAAISFQPRYAPGHSAYNEKPFLDNTLSQSEVRYQWFRHLYQEHPQLQVGGPSTRWVWQGLMAAKQCILMTRQIKLPVLLLQSGHDRIVCNTAQQRFITKLKRTNTHVTMMSIDHAEHEILFEKDIYRNQALEHIMTFMQDNQ